MALGDVDLNLLVALDALLAERNVTRAGRRLGLSQPTTSEALARLRRMFGDPLLVRVGREFQLTPRAEQLVPQVREILELTERAVRERPAFDPAIDRHEFGVSCSDYVSIVLMRRVIELVVTGAPSVEIHLLPRSTDARGLLLRDEVDLVIEPTASMQLERLHSLILFSDRWRVAAWSGDDSGEDRSDPIMSQAEFEGRPYITYTLGASRIPNFADQHLASIGKGRSPIVTTDNFALVPFLVKGTRLVSLVLERGVAVFDNAAEVILHEPPYQMPLLVEAMYWNPRHDAESAHRWLRDVIVAAANEL